MKINKNLIPLIVMTLLLLQFTFGAETIAITSPTSKQDLTIGSGFNLTGTITTVTGDTNSSVNCSLYDRLRNEDFPTTAITTQTATMFNRENTTNFNSLFEIPNEFGKHYMIVRCVESSTAIYNSSQVEVNYKRYAPGEVTESIIDNVVGVIAALFGFVALVVIVILAIWIKKHIRA